MPKMRDLEAVDVDFATSGPRHTTLRQPIAKPADALFRCLVDGPAWNEWLGIDVEWTSPEPFGIGTTRTVKSGPATIDEYFLAWEEGRRMCFRFERCSLLPVSAFAEDYVITAKGDNNCELAWSYAYKWGGPLEPVFAPAFGKFFAFNCKRGLKKLAALMQSTNRFD